MKEKTKKTIIPLAVGTASAILFLVACAILSYATGIFVSILFFILAFFPWTIATGLAGGYFLDTKPNHIEEK